MNTGKKLLDKYAEICKARSDADLARRLGLTRAAVNNWRKGTAHPDAESIEKMANAVGEPVGPWLAQIEAERARTPANRQVWLRLAATLGTTLAVTLTALPAHSNGRLDVQTSTGIMPIVSNMHGCAGKRLRFNALVGIFCWCRIFNVRASY